MLLDRLTQVLQHMKAVGHLPGLRRALTRAFGVETAPIAADNLDAGMLSQPLSGRLGRSVRYHIDHLTPLQIGMIVP